MTGQRSNRRSRVILVALSADGEVIERADLSTDEYYDGDCELIDSDEYRQSRRIRRLLGEVYDPRGSLDQSFENTYADSGRIVRSRTAWADGQVTDKEMP